MERLLFAAFTVAAFGWTSSGFAQDKKDEPKVSEQPIVIEDRLSDTDPKDKVRTDSPHKVHVLKLRAGQRYQIDLMKKNLMQPLDPYLRIEDSTGKQLAVDDDSGGMLNSRIDFSPAKDDSYRIVATCLFGTGEYLLKITPAGAVKAAVPGKVEVVGDTPLELKGNLTRNDPLENGKPGVSHQVKLSAGKAYVIDMTSNQFDAYLKVFDSTGKLLQSDDDGGEQRNARINFQPTKDDTYRIVATSFGLGQGEYNLIIRPAAAAKVDNKIHEVGNGLRLENALARTDGKDAQRTRSYAKIFQVKMTQGKSYTIDLESKAFDCFLRVEDSTGKQLAFDDDGGEGFNSRLVLQAPADGTYRIIATSLAEAVGEFVLRVREN